MARVLIPTYPRRYNHNPKGSATAVVTMKGANPFERTGSREALRPILRAPRPGGLSGLGDGPVLGPPSPAATDSGSKPIDWGKIAEATATAIQPLAAAQAARLLPKPVVQSLPGSAPSALPVGYTVLPQPKSKLPWIIGGVGAVAAIGVLFLVLRRR